MNTPEIHACLVAVIEEAALANSTSVTVIGTTCPATDIAGIDSAQLLGATGELAHRLGIEIPFVENVFVCTEGKRKRGRTVGEIVVRIEELAELAQ